MEVEVLQISLWKPQTSFLKAAGSSAVPGLQTAAQRFPKTGLLQGASLMGHVKLLLLSILATRSGQDVRDTSVANIESSVLLLSYYVQMASGLGAIRFLTNIFLHYYPLLPFSPTSSFSPSFSPSVPTPSFLHLFSCTLAAANFYPAYLATHPDTSSPHPRRPASCFSHLLLNTLISSPKSEHREHRGARAPHAK